MPAIFETGHAKNVANFEEIISFATSFGAKYNPSKPLLKLPNLITLHTAAQTDIINCTSLTVSFNNFTNARAILFNPIRPLATRLIQALSATDASAEVIKDSKTVNRKIQGKRAKSIQVPLDPNAPAPNNISTSQQSYDQLIEHFTKLIEILKAEPSYSPNEIELKITTLTAQLAALKIANTNVTDAYTAVANARIARNITLYKENTGLYDIAADVKNYVKSLYGISSPEYKELSKIKFTKPITA